MNNRNQNQARLPVEPAASPTYLNVFMKPTGKPKRNGRALAPRSHTRRVWDLASS
jgi:hypothetical protein